MDSAGHDILPSTPRCTVVDWRGERVRTLPDRLPPGARAAVVALHPTRCGVDDGHHLHQRLGQQALRRVLAAAGVVPAPGEALDDALVGAGIGIATVVKRPAGREPDLAAGDVAYGVPLLRAELQRHGIATVHDLRRRFTDALDAPLVDGQLLDSLDLDLAGVTFMDATGLGAVMWCRRAALDAGRACIVDAASPAALRMMHLTGTHALLHGRVAPVLPAPPV